MKRVLVSDGKAYVVDERWVTIGGEDEDGGGQHVLIKENGTIVAGFGTGKNVRNAFGGGKADTPEKANEAVAKKKRSLPPLDMPKTPAQARKMIESGELDLINKRLKEQGKADINAAGFEKKQLKLAGQRVGDIEVYEDKDGNLYWVRPSKDDRISPIKKEDGGHILQGKYNEKGEFTSVGKSIGYKTDGELKNIFERMSSYNTAKESVLNHSFKDPKAFAEAEAEAKAKLKEAKRMAKEAPDDEYAKKRLSEMHGYVEGYKERREKGQIPKSWEEREAERKRERLGTPEKANKTAKAKRSDLKRMEQDIANKRAELKNARKKMASPDEIRKLRHELDLMGFNYRKARFPKQYG